jgi:hypothetical protein
MVIPKKQMEDQVWTVEGERREKKTIVTVRLAC